MVERRRFIRTTTGIALGSLLAGCSGSGNGSDATTAEPTATTRTTTEPPTTTTAEPVTEVAVGPERRLRFEPEDVEISVGESVLWIAESEGHNVTSKPGASPRCENPDGAEPFATYEGSNHYELMEVGATFEHEFTVPGEYVYVCAPHAGQGMVGSVTVTE
jgi:plastocyanin